MLFSERNNVTSTGRTSMTSKSCYTKQLRGRCPSTVWYFLNSGNQHVSTNSVDVRNGRRNTTRTIPELHQRRRSNDTNRIFGNSRHSYPCYVAADRLETDIMKFLYTTDNSGRRWMYYLDKDGHMISIYSALRDKRVEYVVSPRAWQPVSCN